MRFIDQATITVRSGKGGRGCVSFRREKFVPKGGPDGGDGGNGGHIIFRATNRLMSLNDFRLKRVYEAQNGQPGMGSQKYGHAGKDLVIDVPVGTLIYEIRSEDEYDPHIIEQATPQEDAEDTPLMGAQEQWVASGANLDTNTTPFNEKGERLLVDLADDGQEYTVCRGGKGGKGNIHFKSSTQRAPRIAQPGEPLQQKTIRMELKILADVGLLGLPNAGKSTFISRISAARPKIAAYPFTTLVPNLGVVMGDTNERLVVADIPGLIEGAHEGQGLGHRFLRHVERTRFLVHLLSAEDLDPDDPWSGFDLINEELRQYNEELARKPQIRVINKIDTLDEETLAKLKEAGREQAKARELFFISALEGDGIERLVREMWRRHNACLDAEKAEGSDDEPGE